VARLGLAQAHSLRGQALYRQGHDTAAAADLDESIEAAEAALGPLGAAGQVRLLAQGYQVLGVAALLAGESRAATGDTAGARAHYERAIGAFEGCIAQEAGAPEDEILRERVVSALCRPQLGQAARALEKLTDDSEGEDS
jgi:hypothetical protein